MSQHHTTNDTAMRSVEGAEKPQYRFYKTEEDFYKLPFEERLPFPPGVPRPKWYLECIYDIASSSDESDERAGTIDSSVSFHSDHGVVNNNEKDDAEVQTSSRPTVDSNHVGEIPALTLDPAIEEVYVTDNSLYRLTPPPSSVRAPASPLAPEPSTQPMPYSDANAPNEPDNEHSSPQISPARSHTRKRTSLPPVQAQRKNKKRSRVPFNEETSGLADLESPNGAEETATASRRRRPRTRKFGPRRYHLTADREVMAAMPDTEVAPTSPTAKKKSKNKKIRVKLRHDRQPKVPYGTGLQGSSDSAVAIDAQIKDTHLWKRLQSVKALRSNQSSRNTGPQLSTPASSRSPAGTTSRSVKKRIGSPSFVWTPA